MSRPCRTDRRAGWLPVVTVLVACVALAAGCGAPPGAWSPSAPPSVPLRAPSSVDPAALASAKTQAGIADCPVSDDRVEPVADGLPDVVLPCLGGGREVRLAGLRGTPMMINIWAQWCAPCRAESPYLADVAATAGEGLMILGIDYDDPQPDWAIEFADLAEWRYPQLVDADRTLRAPLQIAGPPQTLFVRADGTIAHRHSGPFTSAAQIRSLAAHHLGVTL